MLITGPKSDSKLYLGFGERRNKHSSFIVSSVYIMKFTFEFKHPFHEILPSMGLTRLFIPSAGSVRRSSNWNSWPITTNKSKRRDLLASMTCFRNKLRRMKRGKSIATSSTSSRIYLRVVCASSTGHDYKPTKNFLWIFFSPVVASVPTDINLESVGKNELFLADEVWRVRWIWRGVNFACASQIKSLLIPALDYLIYKIRRKLNT